MSVETQTHIGCLVVNTVLGRLSGQYQREIERYLKSNGPEWTVNRLKAVYNAALHLRNGNPSRSVKIYQENSISYHKGTSLPKGILGVVVKRFVEAQKPSVLRRYASVLRFYTGLRLEKSSPKQVQKALGTITAPLKVSKDSLKEYHSTIREVILHGKRLAEYYGIRPEIGKEIYADKLHGTSYYYAPVRMDPSLHGVPFSQMTLSMISTEYVPPSLDERTPCCEMRKIIRNQGFHDDKVGRVVILQEAGCKARVITQPTAWVQLSFMPLHHALDRFTRKMFPVESCTRDQIKGAYAMQEHIANGHKVYSIDLSAATDRFPLKLQTGLLRSWGLGEYADALEDFTSRELECSFAPGGTVKYSVGQPMGLYGSFPLFHISHLVLADLMVKKELVRCATKKLDPPSSFWDGSFFKVLGDDIVISDRSIANGYLRCLKQLGVEISVSKSFFGRVAEFAGFLAIPNRKGDVALFRPYKVPSSNYVSNPVDFLHAIGIKARKLGPKWSDRFDVFRRTMSQRFHDLSPLAEGDHGPTVASLRCDSQTVISLANRIATLTDGLPDLSGTTRVNRIPLFRERGPLDLYGYNPELYKVADKASKNEFRIVSSRFEKDPLVKQVRLLDRYETIYKGWQERQRIEEERKKELEVASLKNPNTAPQLRVEIVAVLVDDSPVQQEEPMQWEPELGR